jgi:undecaprenyl diphosphate synthase
MAEKQITCVGIIMDGNRRWAKKRDLHTLEGHKAGYEKLKESVSWAKEAGIKNLIFYAFSTENWNRTGEEVGYLMELLKTALRQEFDSLKKENVRILFAGTRDRFAPDIRALMEKMEAETKENQEGTIVFALSYGGRAEIVDAVNEIIASGVSAVDETTFSEHLWTRAVPDPEAIIRTGGEKRLSNFLPWQSVYSELIFTDTLWPDLSKEEFLALLEEFSSRSRRRGV